MLAISVRNPWAWCIVHAGKPVENRDWQDTNPAIRHAWSLVKAGERIAIHAGKRLDPDDWEDCKDMCGSSAAISVAVEEAGGLTLSRCRELCGGIIGSAKLIGVIKRGELVDDHRMIAAHASPWRNSTSYALVLADPKPCAFVPCNGALGFFDVPESALEALAA